MVLFTIPTAVVLSIWIGIRGCGWPNSVSIRRTTLASWALRNRAPSSALAAEAATSFRIEQVIMMLPLSLIGSPSVCKLQRKKNPPAQLGAFAADK